MKLHSIHFWLGIQPVERHHQNWLRRDQMICKLPGILSYALDPAYTKACRLSTTQLQNIKTFIYNHGRGEKALSDFDKFLAQDGLFGDKDLLELDAACYWELLSSEFPELSQIALDYVSLPASTASLERAFSMWSYVHNKIRNRLGLETSEKLLFCYHTLNTFRTK